LHHILVTGLDLLPQLPLLAQGHGHQGMEAAGWTLRVHMGVVGRAVHDSGGPWYADSGGREGGHLETGRAEGAECEAKCP
jgi:hypothetical protein